MAPEGKKGVRHPTLCVHIFNQCSHSNCLCNKYGLQQEQADKHFVDGLCDAGPEGQWCLLKPVKIFQSKDELHNSIPTVGLLCAVQSVTRAFRSSVIALESIWMFFCHLYFKIVSNNT